MGRTRLLVGTAITLIMTSGIALAAPKTFTWQSLSGFDGTTYRGISFDESSDSFIKKVFASEKGAYRPEGFLLKTQDPNLRKVEVLLDGRGSKARMTALRLWPSKNFELDVVDLENQLGIPSIEEYQDRRFSDWGVAKFAEKGVLALFEFGRGNRERNRKVVSLILTTPNRADSRDRLQEDSTPIDSLKRLLDNMERRILISGLNLNLSTDKIRNLRSRDDNDLSYTAQREISSRYFVMGRGGNDIQVSVNINKKGNVSVNASLTSSNDIGRLSISSSSSCRLKVDADGFVYYSHSRVEDAVQDAISDLGSSAAYAIKRQKEPTELSLMLRDWDNLTDSWTKS